MKKDYKIAVIVSIETDSYDAALKAVQDNLRLNCEHINGQLDIVYDYEDDNCGQRVVYLPGIEDDNTDYNATDKDTGPYLGAHERGEE